MIFRQNPRETAGIPEAAKQSGGHNNLLQFQQ